MLLALLAATAPRMLVGGRLAVLPRAPVVPSTIRLEPVDITSYESLGAKMTLSDGRDPRTPAMKGASITQLCNDWASHNREHFAALHDRWYPQSKGLF